MILCKLKLARTRGFIRVGYFFKYPCIFQRGMNQIEELIFVMVPRNMYVGLNKPMSDKR